MNQFKHLYYGIAQKMKYFTHTVEETNTPPTLAGQNIQFRGTAALSLQAIDVKSAQNPHF